MIYKTLLKVSNVCQLLDKSKFAATGTLNGVTFHNNGDGSYTLNGTSTDYIYFNFYRLDKKLRAGVVPGVISSAGYYGEDCWYDINNHLVFYLIGTGQTFNNQIIRPQIFDLTEMYGAGHEPTSVEQFRQDFPEEMYDYSPHCFVKSYKTLLKASNVCQLLDKSKYPATQTINGVTFTNNGDGTITVNGTATGLCQYRITNSYKKLIGENTNKCLLVGSISANSGTPYYLQLDFLEGNSWSRAALDFGKGVIFTNSDSSTQLLSIIVKSGVTANNLTFKPQLFDLTEMYGAGNEPTTVEEFRQKFPNELYDYKPYSTIPSYKKSLVCKTKNLLPNYASSKTVNGVTFIVNSDGTITANGTSTDKFLFEFFKPTTPYILDGRYTFSGCDSGSTSSYFLEFFGETTDGDITYRSCINIPIAVNLINYKLISAYINVKSGATLENVIFKPMLNVGDTATDYVPYGHL